MQDRFKFRIFCKSENKMTTNRDKINVMTNEELAEILLTDCTSICSKNCCPIDNDEDDCIKNVVK